MAIFASASLDHAVRALEYQDALWIAMRLIIAVATMGYGLHIAVILFHQEGAGKE